METKVKLDKDTFEVKSNKLYSMGQGTAGGYVFNSEADYYIIVEDKGIKLKSVFNEVEYTTDIDEVNSLNGTFTISGKEYKYKVL